MNIMKEAIITSFASAMKVIGEVGTRDTGLFGLYEPKIDKELIENIK